MTTIDTKLDAATQAADDANARLREAQAEALEADRAAKEHAANEQRAREDAAAAWAKQRQHDWPALHRGERSAAWEAFVDAVRTGADAIGAWVTYRRTCVTIATEADMIAAAYDHVQERDFAPISDMNKQMNELVSDISTAPEGVRRTPAYTSLVDRWHKLADQTLGPDHGEPRAVIVDRPRKHRLKFGRLATDQAETFERGLDKAMQIIEAEQVAAIKADLETELDAAINTNTKSRK